MPRRLFWLRRQNIALYLERAPAAYTLLPVLLFVASSSAASRSTSLRCHSFETTSACLVRDLVLQDEEIQHDYEFNRSLSGSYLSTNEQDPLAVRLDTGSGLLCLDKRSTDLGDKKDLLKLGDGIVPLLFVFRDHINLLHFLRNQLYPTAMLLREFGMERDSFQVVAINGDLYGSARSASSKAALSQQWKFISGREPIEYALGSRLHIHAKIALLGRAQPLFTADDELMSTESVLQQRPMLRWFASWCMQKYKVVHSNARPPISSLSVTVVDRRQVEVQRLAHEEQIAEVLAARFANVHCVAFERLTLKQQMTRVASTDVLFAVHGAALTHVLFLPPWAVVIEIQAYGHGSKIKDFSAGYCNLGRLMDVSYLMWHNDNVNATTPGAAGWDDYKNHVTNLNATTVNSLAAMALDILAQPTHDRNNDECLDVNAPVELA